MPDERRHYCTYCEKKRNESKMTKVYYSLMRKEFWHCIECVRQKETNLVIYYIPSASQIS